MSELDDIKAELADLRRIVSKPKRRKDRRHCVTLRVDDGELALIHATCTERAICCSDLLRIGLSAVIGTVFRINRDTPPELRRFINRSQARQKTVTAAYAQPNSAMGYMPSRNMQAKDAELSDAPSASSILSRPKSG